MKVTPTTIEFSERDFKEVFSLFTSCTAHELEQIDDPNNSLHIEKVNLMEEYELSYEKREYAIDALRAVLAFLYRRGYQLEKDGEILNLSGISKQFSV